MRQFSVNMMAQMPTRRMAFKDDLLGEGMNNGRELIGLIDAAGDANVGPAGEELCGQAKDVAEGGDDEIGFHGAGDFGAEVIRAEGEEVAGGGNEEEANEDELTLVLGGEVEEGCG